MVAVEESRVHCASAVDERAAASTRASRNFDLLLIACSCPNRLDVLGDDRAAAGNGDVAAVGVSEEPHFDLALDPAPGTLQPIREVRPVECRGHDLTVGIFLRLR